MSLKKRIEKIEAKNPVKEEVHFFGWADCEWREAAGLIRGENEEVDDFLDRVIAVSDSKFIWVD